MASLSPSSASSYDSELPPIVRGKGKAHKVIPSSPSCKEKGKAPMVEPVQPKAPASRPPPSGFMATSWHAPPRKKPQKVHPKGALQPPLQPDVDGWQWAERKRKRKSLTRVAPHPSMHPSKVSMDLVVLCFNCFGSDHVAWDCPNTACYLCCRELGHLAQDCHHPRLLPGDHRGRREHRRLTPASKCRPFSITTISSQ
jgi:hypothetical protein